MTLGDRKQVKVVVSGRVQAVGYRAWALYQAEERGLNGWVRNRPDGTVEAVFSGPTAAVDEMVKACESGSTMALVTKIDVTPFTDYVAQGFDMRVG